MAGAKEIRTKIASVTSTQKITNAMQMVAAGKMRKAQERMARGKPYAERIRSVVGHIANAAPECKHCTCSSARCARRVHHRLDSRVVRA
jgi:F-type H+-transporting ATPase subunit gamma